MIKLPGVSILINSYNYADYLGPAIESALNQSHERTQVVVIDDGSTDGSQGVIEGFGSRLQSRIQPNQGQVAACRHGLTLAEHEIVIFLDADDLLDREAAEQVAARWRDGVVKIQYGLRVIDREGEFQGSIFPKYTPSMTPEKVRSDLYRSGSYQDSPTSGNAYSRDFLAEVMPTLEMRHAPDGELNGLAPLYGDVLTIAQPLGSYRIHGRNSYAQGALIAERFKAYIEQDEKRVAFLRRHYRLKGETIGADVLTRDLKHLEYQLVVARLDPPENGSPLEPPKIFWRLLLASRYSSEDLLRRSLRLAWALGAACSPRFLARLLIEQRYVPARRWRWLTRLTT